MFNIIGLTLVLAAVGETGVATGVIDTGSKLANLGAAGILGAVCIACVYALVKLYKDKQTENQATLLTLQTTVTKNTEAISKNSEILERIDETITKCSK